MSNEKRLRLIQVAKEFNVGLNTVTDFLRKNGIKNDGSPNSIVESSVYHILEKEYGGNRNKNNDRESVRERISHKQATVSIEPEKSVEPVEEKPAEAPARSKHMVDGRDSIQQPKILGRIDLDKRPSSTKPVHGKSKGDQPKKDNAPKAEPKPVVVAKPVATPAPAAPVVAASEPAAEPAKDGSIFRPNTQTLSGPQVLGTMDVSGLIL